MKNHMIIFGNDGKKIASTNYWASDHAKRGFFFLSWNAGAARLLVPDAQQAALADMQTAKEIIISRGTLQSHGRDALELLFEDDTDCPFSIQLVTEQGDRLVPESDQGGGFVVAIWTKAGMQFERPGKYRVVKSLPCLKAWVEN